MEFFKSNTKINFMAQRKWAALLSVIFIVASIASLCVYGLQWGLDFTGGTQIQLHYDKAPNISTVRTQLNTAGFSHVTVQTYGTAQDILVTISPNFMKAAMAHQTAEQAKQAIAGRIAKALPGSHTTGVSYIGPQVGQELANQGILAIVVALIATTVYIAIRFVYRLGISSAVALIHDPIIILGVFSFFHIEFDLISLAAILTVIGYSLNDTIVVFDRIRETFRKVRKGTPADIVNMSINQTLSRTIMTSTLTMLAVLSLFFFGGPVLHGFSLAFIIGIVVGTYSSIYVAGALALAIGLTKSDLMPTPKRDVMDRP